MVVARALSMACSAVSWLTGGLVLKMTLRISPVVLCSLSQLALDCGFLTVVGTDLIPNWFSSLWNSCPMNSPPLSWMHQLALGYRDNQQLANCSAM